jgi:hypothetical protein
VKSLLKQQQELVYKTPDGVKIIINQEDPLDIQADIYGPQATPYEGGIFRIKLLIPNEFPHVPPKGKTTHNPRLLRNKNLPPERFSERRDLCQHPKKGLEPQKLVAVSCFGGN